MPSQPSSMQVVSVEKRPSILQDQVFSEKSYSNETFHGVPPSLAEETLPEVTFKSVKKGIYMFYFKVADYLNSTAEYICLS